MGLDMSYGLKFNTNEEAINFYNVLTKSFSNSSDFSIYKNNVSIYYGLNWTGVRNESDLFHSQFIIKNIKPSSNQDEKIIIVDNLKLKFNKNDITPLNSSKIYSFQETENKLQKEFTFPLNPIDLLSLGSWDGSNGESFLIVKDSSNITVYNNNDVYDEELDDYITQDISELTVLNQFPSSNFEENISKNLLFIKEVIDNNPSQYTDIKSREAIFILKYFLYNNVKLFTHMG